MPACFTYQTSLYTLYIYIFFSENTVLLNVNISPCGFTAFRLIVHGKMNKSKKGKMLKLKSSQ